MTPDGNALSGTQRRDIGMAQAKRGKLRLILQAQIAMLSAGMKRPDRIISAEDAAENVRGQYEDGGKWLGSAVQKLARLNVIAPAGFKTSGRPARHASIVRVWRITDDATARIALETLQHVLSSLPDPAAEIGQLFPEYSSVTKL